MKIYCMAVCWLVLVTASATSEEKKAPLPDGWKKARFGMSSEETLAAYPEAAPDRNEPELLFKSYVLAAPCKGVGRVVFFFFKDRLFKIAINFDLTEYEQRFQIQLFEQKYGPSTEKELDWRAGENATKMIWEDGKHAIHVGQLSTGSAARPQVYLAAVYMDIALQSEYEEYAKTAVPHKHALGWDDF